MTFYTKRKRRACWGRRRRWVMVVTAPITSMFLVILMGSVMKTAAAHKKLPEASSTLLKMHRLYTLQPPHDMTLYNILQVSPNATVADITKSYRKLTRDFHPDKRHHHHRRRRTSQHDHHDSSVLHDDDDDDNSETDEDDEKLEQVREAYEVLKDDSTRLPYHKFGLMDTSTAAFLLTGGRSGTKHSSIPTTEQLQLLRWMGFGPPRINTPITRHEQRVLFLAANLIETIRPLVEGAISESTLADAIAQECDALKRLPLGAQILRCIGRAYRHCGQRALRNHHRLGGFRKKTPRFLHHPVHASVAISDTVHDKVRGAKHLLTAALASGKLVLTEHRLSRRKNSKEDAGKPTVPSIGYHMQDDVFIGDDLIGDHEVDDLSHRVQTNQEIQQLEQEKAQNALIEALQVEALWKISKIDLDRTIQEACNLILDGKYFFFPTHQSRKRSERQRRRGRGDDGWVGSTGILIDAREGRLRAASALVLVGNVMVRCSKEGTSWME